MRSDAQRIIDQASEVIGEYVEKSVEKNERMAGMMAVVISKNHANPSVLKEANKNLHIFRSEADSYLDW